MSDELDIPYISLFIMLLNDQRQRDIQLSKCMPNVRQPYILI